MLDRLYILKEYFLNRKYLIIGILVFILIAIVSFYFSFSYKKTSDSNLELLVDQEEVKEEHDIKEKCMIDVKGYVQNAGLYELDCNNRVNDAINIAGGLTNDADTSVINLSKKIKDGMVIVIYSKSEVDNFTEVKKDEAIKEQKCITTSVVVNDACITKNERIDNDNNTSANTNINEEVVDKEINNTPKIVSINTGTLEELMTLKGVGESKALAIIAYREEHGTFTNIEDIKNIKGIGEKMFESIKDFITL